MTERIPRAEWPVCSTHGEEYRYFAEDWSPMGIDVFCQWAIVASSGRVLEECQWRGYLPRGPRHRGFLRDSPSNPNNVSKAAVLTAIAKLEGEHLSIRAQIVQESGLNVHQVQGVLDRCLRYDFTMRSPERVQLVPHGSAHVHYLTERGVAWLKWWGVEMRNGSEED